MGHGGKERGGGGGLLGYVGNEGSMAHQVFSVCLCVSVFVRVRLSPVFPSTPQRLRQTKWQHN